MRTNQKTIKLAKIRRYIRDAIRWHKVDNGMPTFYSSEDYKRSKRGYAKDGWTDFYYTKSDKAIEEIAKKIYNLTNVDTIIVCSKCLSNEHLTLGGINEYFCTKCKTIFMVEIKDTRKT